MIYQRFLVAWLESARAKPVAGDPCGLRECSALPLLCDSIHVGPADDGVGQTWGQGCSTANVAEVRDAAEVRDLLFRPINKTPQKKRFLPSRWKE